MWMTRLLSLLFIVVLVSCKVPEARVTGVVVDGVSGAPVPGVKIVATTNTDIVEEKEFATVTTETDANGRFILASRFPARQFSLVLTKDSYTQAESAVETPVVEQTREVDSIKLYRFPDVNGTVVSAFDDKPLADCIVRMDGKEAKTDAQGKFLFSVFSPGQFVITAECGDLKRKTDVQVDYNAGVVNAGSLFVSNIPESSTGFWRMEPGTNEMKPVSSGYNLSKWFMDVALTTNQCAATSLKSRQGQIRAGDLEPVLASAPTIKRGTVLLSTISNLYAAPIFHSTNQQMMGEDTLSADYYVATDGVEPYVHPYYGKVMPERSWYFKRRVYGVDSVRTVDIDHGSVTMHTIDLPPGLYCLGRGLIDGYWRARSGCVLINVK